MTGSFHVDAPQDMYTMPDQRTWHYITEDQFAVIKSGTKNSLFDYHLLFLGAFLGCIQNVLHVYESIQAKMVPTLGDEAGAFICAMSGMAALVLFATARSRGSPCDKLLKEIESRQKKPVGT